MSLKTHQNSSAPAGAVPAKSNRRIGWIVAGSLGLAIIGVGAVQAQRAPGFDGPGYDGQSDGGPRGGWRGQGGPGGWRHDHAERLQRFCSRDMTRYEPAARLFVKADLRLNKDQETAFDQLADTVLPSLQDIKKEVCATAAQPNGPAPQRLQRRAAVLQKMAEAAQKAVEPTNKFYALLDDTQKARVEQLLAHHRGMRVLFGRADMPMMDGPRGDGQGRWGGQWRGRWGGGQDNGGRPPMAPPQQQ